MRDRKASRNYSPDREEFRRTQKIHRNYGLALRYAEKERRLNLENNHQPATTTHTTAGLQPQSADQVLLDQRATRQSPMPGAPNLDGRPAAARAGRCPGRHPSNRQPCPESNPRQPPTPRQPDPPPPSPA